MSHYQMVRDKRKKGTGTVEIEPAKPDQKIVDLTKPAPHSESLAPPAKPGMPKAEIGPILEPETGKKAEPAPTHPEDWERPQYTGVSKT